MPVTVSGTLTHVDPSQERVVVAEGIPVSNQRSPIEMVDISQVTIVASPVPSNPSIASNPSSFSTTAYPTTAYPTTAYPTTAAPQRPPPANPRSRGFIKPRPRAPSLPAPGRKGKKYCLAAYVVAGVFGISLLVPWAVISADNLVRAGEARSWGELGGLEQQPAKCAVASVFHRNIVAEHAQHYHHPHHPHHPHTPHSHSPSTGRRLSVRHAHTPRPPPPALSHSIHDHRPHTSPHSPTAATPPLHSSPPSLTTATPPLHSSPPSLTTATPPLHSSPPSPTAATPPLHSSPPSPPAATPPLHTSPPSPPAATPPLHTSPPSLTAATPEHTRRLQADAEWPLYPKQLDKCYDRWVLAFTSGAATPSAAGEPLRLTRDRLLARGWTEVAAANWSSDETTVILSEPLHRRRACDFSHSRGAPIYTTGDYAGDYKVVVELYAADVQYAPPASALGCDDVGAWRTNPSESNLIALSGGNRDGEPPFIEWPFDPSAPSAWQLAQMGASMVYRSKQLTHPPQIVRQSGECSLSDSLDRDLPLGCSTREMPAEWAAECPLHAGGQLRCYYMPTPAEPGKFYGCQTAEDVPVETSRLSSVTSQHAGEGPPNPYCMTIFPPKWRVEDWYVATFLGSLARFDPLGLLIAGCILVGIFGLGGLCCLFLA